ncbi:MAG: hypothetical protein KA748_10480 [Halomonas sp.]|nr:hypothetical protein [Halomonas sp.]MBP5980622.1 hypothetical protein [Halomonas sp.]
MFCEVRANTAPAGGGVEPPWPCYPTPAALGALLPRRAAAAGALALTTRYG